MRKPHIYVGADHAGWEIKEAVKAALIRDGYNVVDLGNADLVPDDDYPDFIRPMAERVVTDAGSFGIGVCGSGQGTCMVANKVAGVRAGIGYDVTSAEMMRKDNDANVLCLPGRILDSKTAEGIVHAFLISKSSGEERHARRLKKITEMEKQV